MSLPNPHFAFRNFAAAAGSAWEWWKLLRVTKRIVLHESEFIRFRAWNLAAREVHWL